MPDPSQRLVHHGQISWLRGSGHPQRGIGPRRCATSRAQSDQEKGTEPAVLCDGRPRHRLTERYAESAICNCSSQLQCARLLRYATARHANRARCDLPFNRGSITLRALTWKGSKSPAHAHKHWSASVYRTFNKYNKRTAVCRFVRGVSVGIATERRTCGVSVGLAESPDCTEDEPHSNSGTSALQPLVADHAPGNLTLPDTGRPKGSFRCITSESERAKTGLIAGISRLEDPVLYAAALPRWRAYPLSAGHFRRPTRASCAPCPRRVKTATLRPWPSCSPDRGDPHRHSRGRQGPARLRLLLGRDRLPARRQIARLGRGPRERRGCQL